MRRTIPGLAGVCLALSPLRAGTSSPLELTNGVPTALGTNNPAVYNNLANIYGHTGPVKKAFEFYARAIELNSHEPVY